MNLNPILKMILTLIFLGLTGLQRTAIPDDIVREFVVTTIVDETTADCSTPPGGGARFVGDPFEIDWVIPADLESGELPLPAPTLTINSPYSGYPGRHLNGSVNSIATRSPDPQMPDPPIMTPEPPPVAILTLTGVMLIYLLFGRKR